jgi:hypothetical protein
VNFVGTIFNDYKSVRNFLMEENPGKIIIKTDFFLNASKGQCFLQFLHSSRSGSTRFGASVGCWKRCFQGYEYKKWFIESCKKSLSLPGVHTFLPFRSVNFTKLSGGNRISDNFCYFNKNL